MISQEAHEVSRTENDEDSLFEARVEAAGLRVPGLISTTTASERANVEIHRWETTEEMPSDNVGNVRTV